MALVDYNKTTWVNDNAPALNETNLNNIENGIERVTSAVQALEDNKYVLPGSTSVDIGGIRTKLTTSPNGATLEIFTTN
jgi:hypothetical protein